MENHHFARLAENMNKLMKLVAVFKKYDEYDDDRMFSILIAGCEDTEENPPEADCFEIDASPAVLMYIATKILAISVAGIEDSVAAEAIEHIARAAYTVSRQAREMSEEDDECETCDHCDKCNESVEKEIEKFSWNDFEIGP